METLCLHSQQRAAQEEPAPWAALGTRLAPGAVPESAWHHQEGSSSTASHQAWPRNPTSSEGHPLAMIRTHLDGF